MPPMLYGCAKNLWCVFRGSYADVLFHEQTGCCCLTILEEAADPTPTEAVVAAATAAADTGAWGGGDLLEEEEEEEESATSTTALRSKDPLTGTGGRKLPGSKISRFVGVCWNTQKQKWEAKIDVNGKRRRLGFFNDDEEAARKYDKQAALLNKPVNFPQDYKGQDQARKRSSNTSRFVGVSWNRQLQRWDVKICSNGKQNYVGVFKDEQEAARKYDEQASLLNKPVNFPEEGQDQAVKRRKKNDSAGKGGNDDDDDDMEDDDSFGTWVNRYITAENAKEYVESLPPEGSLPSDQAAPEMMMAATSDKGSHDDDSGDIGPNEMSFDSLYLGLCRLSSISSSDSFTPSSSSRSSFSSLSLSSSSSSSSSSSLSSSLSSSKANASSEERRRKRNMSARSPAVANRFE